MISHNNNEKWKPYFSIICVALNKKKKKLIEILNFYDGSLFIEKSIYMMKLCIMEVSQNVLLLYNKFNLISI